MDELTFLLILAGIGVVLLVAMFTYYKHHKKIHDEIQDFNHHSHAIDDVLLNEREPSEPSDYQSQSNFFSGHDLHDDDMPGSFSASRQDNFDIDQINLKSDASVSVDYTEADRVNYDKSAPADNMNNRELVDGVYINTKRVIQNPQQSRPVLSSFKKTTDTFNTFVRSNGHQNEQKYSSELKQETTDRVPTAEPIRPATLNKDSYSSAQSHSGQVQTNTETPQTQPGQSEPVPRTIRSHEHINQTSLIDKEPSKQIIKIVYDPVPEGVTELIISHTILSKGEYFKGPQLFKAIQSAGLRFGEMNIFHYPGDDSSQTFALFSIANVVEPGIFNLQEAETFSTPGISMFMRLPTRKDNYEAYEEFIHIAQLITSELDGELCDETRSQLTQQAITYKKEQIRKLNFEIAKAKKLAGMR